MLGWTPAGKSDGDWANRLCNREEALIDFEARRLARAARKPLKEAQRAALEKRARRLEARLHRYRAAREQVKTDPRNANRTFKTKEWNGVPVGMGARHTDGSFVMMGTLFLLPLVFWGCWRVETFIIRLTRDGFLPRVIEGVLDYGMALFAVASVVLLPVFLGLFPRTARWITWSLALAAFYSFMWFETRLPSSR